MWRSAFLGRVREDRVWGPGWGWEAPHPGKRLRGGAAEMQLRLWPARPSCGCLLPQPTRRSAAGSCLLSGGPWPSLGCCFSWSSGVQHCPQVSTPLHPSLCPPSGPKPTSSLWVSLVCEGCREAGQRYLGSPEEGLARSPLSPSPLYPASKLPCPGVPKSCSPRVHRVGREGAHLLERVGQVCMMGRVG